MRKNTILSITAMMVGVLLSGTAMAMQPGGPGGGEPGMIDDRPGMFRGLELTDDQVVTLKKNKKAKHRKMIKLRAALEETKLDLADELDKAKPDRGKVKKIAAKIGELHAQKVLQRAESIIELKAILTPDQIKKLDTMMLMRGGPEGGMGQHGFRGNNHGKGKGKGKGKDKGRF